MDTVKRYRQIIRKVMEPYTRVEYANAEIQNELVWDEENDRYLIVSQGWGTRPKGRIHGCLVHLDVIDGKIWVQRDGTEGGIAGKLEEAGVPKTDIVLGFQPEQFRQYTDYAVA